jgi:DNA-directed RNA polymerase subunit RPC12/RpoP
VQNDGQATDAEVQRTEDWFREKDVQPTCSQCGRDINRVGPPLAAFAIDSDGKVGAGGTPMLPISCHYCGHIEWFNPEVMGVLPREGGRLS